MDNLKKVYDFPNDVTYYYDTTIEPKKGDACLDKDGDYFLYDDNLKDEFYAVIVSETEGDSECLVEEFESDEKYVKQYVEDEAKRIEDRKKNPLIEFYNDGSIRCKSFHNQDGMLHNEDGPALIEYFEDGQVSHMSYYLHGVINREDGPAIQWWFRNGNKKCEKYILGGHEYRKKGPTELIWYEDGRKYGEYYISNSVYHREDGPAIIHWYDEEIVERYYLNGIFQKQYSEIEKCN